jgi:hypothetical protein
MKAKSYAEAEALVKQNLGQMANDAEKAKAYNKLVDLAMKQFNDQQSIQQTNQIMKKNDPVDEAAMSEGAYNALINAIECYKYDQLPNAKGKVATKDSDSGINSKYKPSQIAPAINKKGSGCFCVNSLTVMRALIFFSYQNNYIVPTKKTPTTQKRCR